MSCSDPEEEAKKLVQEAHTAVVTAQWLSLELSAVVIIPLFQVGSVLREIDLKLPL